MGLVAGCTSDPADPDDEGGNPLATCVVRPELTEGPYFVDEQINRSDIRTDPATGAVKAGTLLTLTFNLMRITGNACTNLPGVFVDVWHCDALGLYSDVSSNGTVGQKFLRGYSDHGQ